MEVLINLGIFIFLIVFALLAGQHAERKHLLSLQRREQQLHDMLVTQLRSFPEGAFDDSPPRLFVAEVVIATDYLKSFLAKLRGIFGGEVKSFQSLLIRAHREATLRVLEQACEEGYDAVCNLRMQTADVGGNSTVRKVAMVAILASGTAYHTKGPTNERI